MHALWVGGGQCCAISTALLCVALLPPALSQLPVPAACAHGDDDDDGEGSSKEEDGNEAEPGSELTRALLTHARNASIRSAISKLWS